jgi:hypothetical protein
MRCSANGSANNARTTALWSAFRVEFMHGSVQNSPKNAVAALVLCAIALIIFEIFLYGYFPGKLENSHTGISKPIIHGNRAEISVSLNALDSDPSTVIALGQTLLKSAKASRWGLFDVPKDVDLIAFNFSVTSLDGRGLTHKRRWASLIVERRQLVDADENLNSTTALNLVTSVRFEHPMASSMTREFCGTAPSRHLARHFCDALGQTR